MHSQPQPPRAEHRPRDFRIVTPSNWYVLDLDPATRDAAIAGLVERRFGATDDPQMAQARRELTALLRGAARDAQENGAVYAALMDVLVDGVALSASLIAVLADAPVDEDGNVVTDPAALSELLLATELAEAVEAALGPAAAAADRSAAPGGATAADELDAPDGPGGADNVATRDDRAAADDSGEAAPDAATAAVDRAAADDPAAPDDGTPGGGGAPEIVELPAGPAIRLRRITDSGAAGSTGQTVRAAETQYFVPVPNTSRMLVLTFATPNVDFRWHFDELFDRIARTLEWEWEKQPP